MKNRNCVVINKSVNKTKLESHSDVNGLLKRWLNHSEWLAIIETEMVCGKV